MLCLPVNAYCSRSICVLFIFIIESPFLLYYLILFILFLFQFFRVANQIRIIHMGRSQRWDCLVVWFCYQLMARLDGRMVAPSWPGPCEISQNLVIIPTKWILIYVCIKFYTNQYVCVYYFILHHTYVWYKSFCFLPEASFGLWVLSLPASVCVYVCVCGNHLLVYVCVCGNNLSPVQASNTKFGPEEQNTLVKIPIVCGVNWPWTSRSNSTSK